MTEELCRSKFEEWQRTLDGFSEFWLDREGEGYYWDNSNSEWIGWQAAWNTRAEMEKSDE